MRVYSAAAMCDVIDVTLFKFNHYDNLIWTKALNQLDYLQADDNSIIISPEQMQLLLDSNFGREIKRIKATTFELIHRDASSIFFLDKIVEEFENLKWIKLSLSKSRSFSRMVEDFEGGNRQIKYSYKILKATLRLSDFLPVADINRINKPLKQIGIIIDKPYKTHATRDLVMQIEMAMNSDTVDDTSAEILSFILDVIDNKLEGDNPDILFVTDW
jgi:hypothetical protein